MKDQISKAGVTMVDVARKAGVHSSTVSRALKNDSRITDAVRKHVKAVADELGYRPNPLISALSTLRRQNTQLTTPTTLGYIQRGYTGETPHLVGAREVASLCGYKVELFCINQALSETRLNEILTYRNIRGLILAPLLEAHGFFKLDWDRFACVALEYSFVEPRFDRVVPDSFLSVMQVLKQCQSMGHTRVGLVLTRFVHERNEGLLAAAYQYGRQENPGLAELQPLIVPAAQANEALPDWLKRERPQVIISSNHMASAIQQSLDKLNISVPNQIGLINLNTFPSEHAQTGINLDPKAMGSRAATHLISKLNNNQFGIPTARVTIQTDITWVDGDTLIPAKAMSQPAAFKN